MTKKLDIAYRIATIATAVAAVLSLVYVIICVVEIQDLDEMTKDFMVKFAFIIEMFYAAFAGSVISVVLSICSAKSSKPLFVVGRTLFISVVLFIQVSALKTVNGMYPVLRAFKKYDFETEADLKNTEPEDLGLTQDQVDSFLSGDDIENGIVALALAIIFGAAVYFAIGIISAVSLASKKNKETQM